MRHPHEAVILERLSKNRSDEIKHRVRSLGHIKKAKLID